jgi:hypothetical protein
VYVLQANDVIAAEYLSLIRDPGLGILQKLGWIKAIFSVILLYENIKGI